MKWRSKTKENLERRCGKRLTDPATKQSSKWRKLIKDILNNTHNFHKTGSE